MIRLLTFFSLLFLFSCEISPVPIEYHEDQCMACKMTIADARFGAELVTKKGKIYKFDAIECLIPEVVKNTEPLYEFVLVTDFDQPKELIDARSAWYLISENLPSPMGGFLSSYKSKSAGEAALVRNGGELLQWEALKNHQKFAQLK